jgi:5-deoxy-5-amino-3-dehydroquinate synthase
MSVLRTVRVPLVDRPYDVLIGHGARRELATLLPTTARRAVIVTQAGIPIDIEPGLPAEVVLIGQGEAYKQLDTIGAVCDEFARIGLTRNDVVIGVGGGMVTDVAGFAASVWHRGVAVVHVATTLLGMIDAAIGGKTGVNVASGKNLVGSFWQPCGVVCDLDALSTLPPRELRCGRGEMAKYHFLTGDDLLAMDEVDRIARCVEIKARVVAADERESAQQQPGQQSGRAILNYGHTLAHALEIETDHALAHGEAVAVGLIYAAHLARELGRIDDVRVQQHVDVVAGAYELATTLPAGVDHERLVALMARDKKALDGLTFVLDGPQGVELVPGVAPDAAMAALASLAAS